jgi:ABC-type dipeptide/oligopeptide/nickel transport system permease subunit
MGAGPWRILFDVVAREALGPLIVVTLVTVGDSELT